MKKILIILITIPLIFGSCEKEDNSPNSGTNNGSNNTSGSILGTWKLMTYTSNSVMGYIDPVFLTEVEIVTETNSGPPSGTDEYFRYLDDGIFSVFLYHNDTLSSYYHFEYEKNGNMIEISSGYTQRVTLLTSNNFNWWYVDEYTWEINDTSFFDRQTTNCQFIKSQLPSITTEPLNKKKPVSGYNSFLNRRENR
jgi:hypothetical protein